MCVSVNAGVSSPGAGGTYLTGLVDSSATVYHNELSLIPTFLGDVRRLTLKRARTLSFGQGMGNLFGKGHLHIYIRARRNIYSPEIGLLYLSKI